MEAKEIVAQEVARQKEFGCEPSWEDFVIAGETDGYVKGFDAAEATMIPRATEDGKLTGRREVVEAIEKYGIVYRGNPWWDKKLKGWGIKSG